MNLFAPERRTVAVVAAPYNVPGEIYDALVLAASEAFSPAEIGDDTFDWSRVRGLITGARTSGGRHVLAYAEVKGMGVEHFATVGYIKAATKAVRLIHRKPAALLVVGDSDVGAEAIASARRNGVPVVARGLKAAA